MTLPTNGPISHTDIMAEYSHPRSDFLLSGDGAPILSRPTGAQVKESDFYGLSANVAPPIYGGTINGITALVTASGGQTKTQFRMDAGTAAQLLPAPQANPAYSAHGRQNYASSTGGVTDGRYYYDIDNLFNGNIGDVPNRYADNPYLIGPCCDGRNAEADLHHLALYHQNHRDGYLYKVKQDGSLGPRFLTIPQWPDLPQGGRGHMYREQMGVWWPKKGCWAWGGFNILKASDGTQNVSFQATISFVYNNGTVMGPYPLQNTFFGIGGNPQISLAGDFIFAYGDGGGSIRKYYDATQSGYEGLSPLGSFGSKFDWYNMFFFKGKYYSVTGTPGVGNDNPWRTSSLSGSPEEVTSWPSGWVGQWGFTANDGTVACIHARKKGNNQISRWFWTTDGNTWRNIGGDLSLDCQYGYLNTA